MKNLKEIGLYLVLVSIVVACESPTSNKQNFDLVITANPSEGGSVNAVNGTYEENTPVMIQATPVDGWRFTGWSGDVTGNGNPQTIRMTRNYTITASFEKRNYELTLQIEGSGTILEEVVTGREYPYQTTVRLTAQPTEGWQLYRWEGALSGSENPQTVTITAATTVKAVFIQSMASFEVGEPVYLDETQAQISGSVSFSQGLSGATVGLCYGLSSDPQDSDICRAIDGNEETFTLNMSQLEDNTRYFVRGYTRINDESNYSENLIEFSTPQASYQKGSGVTDIDGNHYKTVIIGEQEWMAENLRTNRYSDGSEILASHIRIRDGFFLDNYFSPNSFRNLYSRNVIEYADATVCPSGWHVPSLGEWNYMIDTIGRDQGGSKLRSKGPIYWNSSNNATNETGFSAIGAGYSEISNISSSFKNLFLTANYYTSTAGGRGFNWSVQIRYDSDEITTESLTEFLAIRCVKDGFNVPTEPLAVVSMPQIIDIMTTRATIETTYEQPGAHGITERGFCIGATNDPTIYEVCYSDNEYGPGTFRFEVSGLSAQSTYFVRGYAFTEDGLSYGPSTSFTTTSD